MSCISVEGDFPKKCISVEWSDYSLDDGGGGFDTFNFSFHFVCGKTDATYNLVVLFPKEGRFAYYSKGYTDEPVCENPDSITYSQNMTYEIVGYDLDGDSNEKRTVRIHLDSSNMQYCESEPPNTRKIFNASCYNETGIDGVGEAIDETVEGCSDTIEVFTEPFVIDAR